MNNISELLVYLTHPYVKCWNFNSSHEKSIRRAFPGLKMSVCRNSKEFLDQLPQAQIAIVWYFKAEWLEISRCQTNRSMLIYLSMAQRLAMEIFFHEGQQADGPVRWSNFTRSSPKSAAKKK